MEKKHLMSIGLLVLRLGFGIMFLIHGTPKLLGGPESWQQLGESGMAAFGLSSGLVFWGFMAAFAEFFGGLFLFIGFLTRPFAILLLGNMFVAAVMHLTQGHDFSIVSHPIEDGLVFIFFLIVGPGKYSVRHLVDPFKRRWFV